MSNPYDPHGPGVPGPSFEPAGYGFHGGPSPRPSPTTNLYGQSVDPYGQQPSPHGSYGAVSYRVQSYPQAPAKSKVAAALLAFFLGGFGAHSFYLGRAGLGLGHLALAIVSFLLMIGGVVGAGSTQVDSLLLMSGLGYLLSAANGLWALVDFIIILAKPESELGR